MGGILQKQRIGHKRNFWCSTFGARHQTGTQSGGPGVLAIAVEIARGLSPVSAGYLMAFECHSCLDPFGDVWSDPLRAWRLGEKPSRGVPSPPWGSLGLTQRRKDAKTDGEMRDCPRGFSREGRIDDCRVMIVDFRSGRSPQIGARHIKQGPRCASIWGGGWV